MSFHLYPTGDTSWRDLEVGDTVKIKSSLPHGNSFGVLLEYNEQTGECLVGFPNSPPEQYHRDGLIRILTQGQKERREA